MRIRMDIIGGSADWLVDRLWKCDWLIGLSTVISRGVRSQHLKELVGRSMRLVDWLVGRMGVIGYLVGWSRSRFPGGAEAPEALVDRSMRLIKWVGG